MRNRSDFFLTLRYMRTKDDAEIDLVIERPGMPNALIEIKSTDKVDDDDVASLRRFLPDFPGASPLCLSLDPNPKVLHGIECVYWTQGIREIFGG